MKNALLPNPDFFHRISLMLSNNVIFYYKAFEVGVTRKFFLMKIPKPGFWPEKKTRKTTHKKFFLLLE